MAQKFYQEPEGRGVGFPVIGKNSEQFSKADPVTIDSDGFLTVATAGDKIIGWCTEDVTMASDNQTVAKYKPEYVIASGQLMVISGDQDLTQTDVGAYADISGTTGAIAVNLVAGTSGQLFVWGSDPDQDAGEIVVSVAEPQELGFTQD